MTTHVSIQQKPVVAIVGRPNVGKSTLFNRLLHRRIAITADEPGTTRDRVAGETSWDDRAFTLVDTGGMEMAPTSAITQKVLEQVSEAIKQANVVIFLTSVQEGVTPADEEIAEVLRKSGKPVVLAVNKVDVPQHSRGLAEFYRLGMGDPVGVSSHHNLGMYDLMDLVVEKLPERPTQAPREVAFKLAIVGRPNVGKSMLLNALLGEERVIVDAAPGTTRDAIDTLMHHDGTPVLLIDTAGIRRRGRVEVGVEKFSVARALEAIERCDVAVLVLDATELAMAQDQHVAEYIIKAHKGIILAINKWDLAPKLGLDEKQSLEIIRDKFRFAPYAPVLHISAESRWRTEEVLSTASRIMDERNKRMGTGRLNQAIGDALAAHLPPSAKGRHLHILYVTQAEINPPTFVFFVNNPALVHFSYRRYLENKLREAFGFEGTPLQLVFRGRKERE